MHVYEKPTGISGWLLGFVTHRELLTFVFPEQVFYSSASLGLRPCHRRNMCVPATRAETRTIPATQQEVVYG